MLATPAYSLQLLQLTSRLLYSLAQKLHAVIRHWVLGQAQVRQHSVVDQRQRQETTGVSFEVALVQSTGTQSRRGWTGTAHTGYTCPRGRGSSLPQFTLLYFRDRIFSRPGWLGTPFVDEDNPEYSCLRVLSIVVIR